MICKEKYGSWALIAGASKGLGYAFCEYLAREGCNLVMVAQQRLELRDAARTISDTYGVEAITLCADLASADIVEKIDQAAGNRDIGILVYNAAAVHVGAFYEAPMKTYEYMIQVNCTAPLKLSYHFGAKFMKRKRGAILLMSSMAGFQGGPYVSLYAATKAFNLVLGEGLWYELEQQGIDVIASTPGPIDTPAYRASLGGGKSSVPVLSPEQTVQETFAALGKKPSLTPGKLNRFFRFIMGHLMTRALAIRLIGKNTEKLS